MKLRRDWWILCLLVLAALHCTQSIFFDNWSFIDLSAYENGHAMNPFQERVGMIPLLRLAHGHPALDKAAHSLAQDVGRQHIKVEPYTAEKLACFWAGAASMLVIVGACIRFGLRTNRRLWWACPALVLAIFYASYAARADQNVWYPYDLPHTCLFTLALLALLEGQWWVVAGCFALDAPTRETAVYLIPCLWAVSLAQDRLKRGLLFSVPLVAYWVAVRVAVMHLYGHNPSDTSMHYHQAWHALSNVKYWPQLASTLGFMIVPLYATRKLLTRDQIALAAAALPGILFSALMGVWYESRVWAEWSGAVACLAFAVFSRYLAQVYAQPAAYAFTVPVEANSIEPVSETVSA
jgi:hypothetical protein